jgi:metal-responsive CopG/Arc/MetJ family transcriptional regulator
MAVIYEKTYRPIHLNVDADLLGRLDDYRSATMPRSKLIHAALEHYLDHLQKTGARKSTWSVFGGR